jgi:hypothetical protein
MLVIAIVFVVSRDWHQQLTAAQCLVQTLWLTIHHNQYLMQKQQRIKD